MKKTVFRVLLLHILMLPYGVCSGATYYVDASKPDDSGDGMSWSTAKKTIQAAVDLAVDNDTVLVTNGVYDSGGKVTPGYALMNRVVITSDIKLQAVSANPLDTTIKGAGPQGDSAIRCVYMTKGQLIGFTVTNGFTRARPPGVQGFEDVGGGIYANGTGVISNCVITGNSSYWRGGGVFNGTVRNSFIHSNSSGPATEGGGGAWGSTMYNCVISNNAAINGGGVGNGTCCDCLIVNNSSTQTGGGCYSSVTCYKCMIMGNVAGTYAGGVYQGTYYSCLIVKNHADNSGGASYGVSKFKNCTIVSNSAASAGGGVMNGYTATNCIIYYNSASSSPNWRQDGANKAMGYCCTSPTNDLVDPGNITNQPMFVDKDGGDYRLRFHSPCIDTGVDSIAVTNDLDGIVRPLDGTGDDDAKWDMGCYEYVMPPGGTVLTFW